MKRLTALLLSYLVLLSITAAAQERKLQYRPYIDQRRFHYGFFVGVHMQDMELRLEKLLLPTLEQVIALEAQQERWSGLSPFGMDR